MKRTKALLAILLMLALVLTFAVGCNSETKTKVTNAVAPAEGDKVQFVLGWWGNPTRDQQTRDVRTLIQNELGNMTVLDVTTGFGNYWPLLATYAAADALPTVMQHDWSMLKTYVDNGHLVPLTDLIKDGLIDVSNYDSAVLDLGKIGGVQYAIPLGMNGICMFYNKTLTDSLGITINEGGMTLDEFAAISKQIYTETGVKTQFAFDDPSNPLEFFLRAKDVQWLDSAKGVGGTAADYVAFFEFLKKGIDEGWHMTTEEWLGRDVTKVPENPLVLKDEDAGRMSWMSLQWTNQISAFQGSTQDTLAMAVYPSDNTAKSNYIKGGMYFAITTDYSRTSQQIWAGAKFINTWINSTAVADIIRLERGLPANNAILEHLEPTLGALEIAQKDFIQDNLMGDKSSSCEPARPAGASEILTLLRNLCYDVANGAKTPQQAADALIAQGNQIITDNK